MKRLSSSFIYALIAVLAVLAFLRLGVVERSVYAAVAASPRISTVPVIDGWYGSDQVSGQVGVPNRWADILGNSSDLDNVAAPVYSLTGDQMVAAPCTGGSSAAAVIVSDDFNACSLDTGLWRFIDPRADVTQTLTGTFTQDAWLSFEITAGTSHDIWEDGNFAPRIMQSADDADFEIEAKFESGLSGQYQMQGILVEQDDDDFLRLEFYSDGGAYTNLFAVILEPGSPKPLKYTIKYNQPITGTGEAPLYMRVGREGDEWTQSYSYDGVDWTTAVTFTHELTVTAVGLYAANAGDSPPAHTGYIDYFFNTASPVVPEDGERNTLTVHAVGSGSVITEPAKSNYDCGEVVTLTATADPGWTFAGWSGALSGSANPATVTMTGGRVITGTFTRDEYTLVVNRVGNGRVDKDPDQATYQYGDVVTLTATADPGWTFVGWSGALSGTDNPESITVTGDTTVTATFTQKEYTLMVNVVGNGSVTVDPDQASYHYGDAVTLTAVAAPGWTFAGWSGALSGTGNPKRITITGNATVTATFVATEEYTLTVNVVGNGSVTVDPDQATYHYGDVVTLTATAAPAWAFVGWSGALSGADNPETIAITGDATVTATFVATEEYTLTVNVVGSGSVEKDPDRVTYHYGDVVTLTATPGPGWTFAGWSGALSGADNPETITITGDATVTATFTWDEYTLTVSVVGNGSVAVDPDQVTYHYGDVVTLTATADPSWTFVRWGGDLSGSDNPETITIVDNTTITATFNYRIFLPLVTRATQTPPRAPAVRTPYAPVGGSIYRR